MPKGRKPKPTALKLLDGTRKDRVNSSEPTATPGLAKPPAHLGKVARAKWKQLAKDVTWFATVDGDAVALYCLAWANSVEALAMIGPSDAKGKTGMVLKSVEGGLYQNPWVPIYNKAVEQLCKLGAVLGLNPSDRSRMKMDTGSKDDDELDAFMRAAK